MNYFMVENSNNPKDISLFIENGYSFEIKNKNYKKMKVKDIQIRNKKYYNINNDIIRIDLGDGKSYNFSFVPDIYEKNGLYENSEYDILDSYNGFNTQLEKYNLSMYYNEYDNVYKLKNNSKNEIIITFTKKWIQIFGFSNLSYKILPGEYILSNKKPVLISPVFFIKINDNNINELYNGDNIIEYTCKYPNFDNTIHLKSSKSILIKIYDVFGNEVEFLEPIVITLTLFN